MPNMILNIERVQNKRLKRYLEHSVYLTILFVLIPAFLFFELGVVLPTVAEAWSSEYIAHVTCVAFLLMNIMGNMLYGMLVETSIKGRTFQQFRDKADWTFCSVCETSRPPRAWHCDTCDICILKRDHHCTFFACCVGHFNHRYFIYFVFYVFIAMAYAFYYNVKFLATFIAWNHGIVIIKFVFPLASFFLDFGYESLYIFLVVINVVVCAFTGFLFFYHFNNMLHGKVTPENKLIDKENMYPYNQGWKSNIKEVFGDRWFLTWISPYVHSPLPGDGIKWHCADKRK